MNETRYMISDASKQLAVEPHVLRYWEEELEMDIKRNEMGHRYYLQEDIEALKHVRDLKNQGFQLKAIKILLPDLYADKEFDLNKMVKLRDELNKRSEEKESAPPKDNLVPITRVQKQTVAAAPAQPVTTVTSEKMEQFQAIINRAFAAAIRENNKSLGQAMGDHVSEKILKQVDYLMRENDDRSEERYQRLDNTIRELQRANKEAAATQMEDTKKRKKGLFKRAKS